MSKLKKYLIYAGVAVVTFLIVALCMFLMDKNKANKMVKEFYGLQGFTKVSEDEEGNTTWEYSIEENYKNKNKYINVNTKEGFR